MDLTGATIAFDLDGTLVDTAPDLIGTLNHMLGARGLAEVKVAEARHLVGRGARSLIEHGFKRAGATLTPQAASDLTERFVELYAERIARLSRPFPGAVQALQTLGAAGARLAVCTNKRSDLSISLLEALGMTSLFKAIVGPDKVSARKPAAAHLIEAVALAGGDISRALMVGDSEPDVRSARSAGAPIILVSFGYTPVPVTALHPDAILDRFEDLHGLVDQLLG